MKYNDRVRTLQLQNGTKSKKHIRLNRGVVKAKMPQDNVNREQVVVGTNYKGTTLKMPQYDTDKDSLIGSTSDYGDNGKVMMEMIIRMFSLLCNTVTTKSRLLEEGS